ncbi:hypothetical protein HU200_004753 [Digitaria exilis]|uniref:HTH myb-type domain-containing protein n=1 Tax=Digitaria exilis TaxID=1010633 RepID=A0A835FT71_9POAL|nr:hypothetical protein HU200_004753 [Digitaria exilis]
MTTAAHKRSRVCNTIGPCEDQNRGRLWRFAISRPRAATRTAYKFPANPNVQTPSQITSSPGARRVSACPSRTAPRQNTMRAPSDSLHGRVRSASAPTDHRDIVRNPSRLLLLGRRPCVTSPGEFVMLSPRGGRPHHATTAAPASLSPSFSPPRRRAGMDADGESRSGRVLEWEIGLPSASELTPLWHPLITPALATAFRINIAGATFAAFDDSPYAHDSPTSHLSLLFDEDDGEEEVVEEGEQEEEEEEGAAAAETEDAASGSCACRGGRPRKKARMVWTPELHHRFVEAVAHLGDKGAVPKAIVRFMNVEGLTRENVASHLQKYRIYLKRTRNTSMPRRLLAPPTGAVTARSPPATVRTSNANKQ